MKIKIRSYLKKQKEKLKKHKSFAPMFTVQQHKSNAQPANKEAMCQRPLSRNFDPSSPLAFPTISQLLVTDWTPIPAPPPLPFLPLLLTVAPAFCVWIYQNDKARVAHEPRQEFESCFFYRKKHFPGSSKHLLAAYELRRKVEEMGRICVVVGLFGDANKGLRRCWSWKMAAGLTDEERPTQQDHQGLQKDDWESFVVRQWKKCFLNDSATEGLHVGLQKKMRIFDYTISAMLHAFYTKKCF